jgi:uncharacterized integral membrane protein
VTGIPDLTTPEGRAAYRKELRGVARPVRLIGLTLALTGVAVGASRYFIEPWPAPLRYAALAMCIVGIILMLIGMIQRTRYHIRRLSGR